MTFKRKKAPITISETQKNIDAAGLLESIILYIIFVQPSNVIIVKIVRIAAGRLSKLLSP